MNPTLIIVIFLAISLILFLVSSIRAYFGQSSAVAGGLITSQQTAGFFLWQGFDRWFNYIVYPAVIGLYGIWYGGAVMIVVTLVFNTIYIVINNQTESDWTFMSWITHLRDSQTPVWPLRYVRVLKALKLWFIRKLLVSFLHLVRKTFRIKIGKIEIGNLIGFAYLSVWKDSFYAINFLYHKKADLFDKKVLGLYLSSHLICNFAWIPIAWLMAQVAKTLVELF